MRENVIRFSPKPANNKFTFLFVSGTIASVFDAKQTNVKFPFLALGELFRMAWVPLLLLLPWLNRLGVIASPGVTWNGRVEVEIVDVDDADIDADAIVV